MKMRYVVTPLILVLLMCSSVFAGDGKEVNEKEKAAAQAAEQWLKLVDAANYGDSWEEAATFFKKKVTKDHWQQAMQQSRAPLGKVNSRTLKSTNYTTVLPNAPKGEYVIVQFESSFEGMNHTIETVTPLVDKDGKWRVSGYYFRPAGM